MPTIVKDNFETIGLQSANGSLALDGFVSNKDAFQVKRIKDAGAIVLAKSNMAEWAFTPYETVSSILPGYTKNPYALDRVTAGSSGGTAAAVAASFGAVGLGTDTGNSIRGPVVASGAGRHPLDDGPDQPRRRHAAQPARRHRRADGAHGDRRGGRVPGDRRRGSATIRRRRRLADAVPRELRDGARARRAARRAHRRAAAGVRARHDRRRNRGGVHDGGRGSATRRRDDRRSGACRGTRRRSAAPQGAGPCKGFKYDINRYLASHGDRVPVHNLAEIVKSRPVPSDGAAAARTGRTGAGERPRHAGVQGGSGRIASRCARRCTKTMDAQKLDAFVYPTWSNPPRLIGDLNTPHGDNSQFFSPTTGFPSIQVPMGYTRGGLLPAGITFFGRAWAEATLIKLAYAYEQATRHRRPPATTPPIR